MAVSTGDTRKGLRQIPGFAGERALHALIFEEARQLQSSVVYFHRAQPYVHGTTLPWSIPKALEKTTALGASLAY